VPVVESGIEVLRITVVVWKPLRASEGVRAVQRCIPPTEEVEFARQHLR
jgi:hypothetical protein